MAVLVTCAGLLILVLRSKRANPFAQAQIYTTTNNIAKASAREGTQTTNLISRSQRRKIVMDDRLTVLEGLGEVPSDANLDDWHIAERTSWWGKRIDPQKFWKNRIVWLDSSATLAARRRGRLYPPIPFEAFGLPEYPSDEGSDHASLAWEGSEPHFHVNSLERAYWEEFAKTHPRPPEDLETKQLEVSETLLKMQKYAETHVGLAGISNQTMDDSRTMVKTRVLNRGYPPEALSDDALFWSYVLAKRKDYQDLLNAGQPPTGIAVQNLLKHLAVETTLVTAPPNEQALQSANAWKVAYLQRLQNENTNESYISAYLKAWSLSSTSVFNRGK